MGRTKNKKDIKQAVVGRARKGDNEIEVVRRLFPGERCLGSDGGWGGCAGQVLADPPQRSGTASVF